MKLILETGDVEAKPTVIRNISIELKDSKDIEFSFENKLAIIQQSQWAIFIDQVEKRELKMWKLKRYPPPIGNYDFVNLLRNINTTSQYQLFLAVVDVAKELNFPNIYELEQFSGLPRTFSDLQYSAPLVNKLMFYFQKKLNYKLISSDKSLFILPLTFYDLTSPELKELIIFNQLGKIKINYLFESFIEFYYRPYFSPFAFRGQLSEKAKQLLQHIGNLKKALK
jgi:hypothetical protein